MHQEGKANILFYKLKKINGGKNILMTLHLREKQLSLAAGAESMC